MDEPAGGGARVEADRRPRSALRRPAGALVGRAPSRGACGLSDPIPMPRACKNWEVARDGSGLCKNCGLPRKLHHDQCPACCRRGMKGKRHKRKRLGAWCDGKPNRLRDRAISWIAKARDEAIADTRKIPRFRYASDLYLRGDLESVLVFLQSGGDVPPEGLPVRARQVALAIEGTGPKRKRGELIKFNPQGGASGRSGKG